MTDLIPYILACKHENYYFEFNTQFWFVMAIVFVY